MRKLFLAVAVVSMGLFSSCDKCKDKTCQNSASCDKKTGDCANVCKNGGTSDAGTGACSCTEFYNGKTCSDEVRTELEGKYDGTLDIPALGASFSSITNVSNNGTDATSQEFVITTTIPGSAQSVITILGNLTAVDSVTIVQSVIPFSLVPNNTEATITGTGYYVNGRLFANMTLVPKTTGGSIAVSFKGIK